MIEAILIDIDNTLLDFRKCSRIALKHGLDIYGIEYRPEMYPTFERINNALWYEIELGTLDIAGLYKVRWNRVFNALGIDVDGEEFEEHFVRFMHDAAEPVDYAHETLTYLAQKYRVYAASNAPLEQQRKRLTDAGMMSCLSGLFTSEELGCSKPDSAFYTACFDRMGNPAPESVMAIGDSIHADITGATAYGMKTCWFNIHGNPIPEEKPDYIINDLREIRNIL